MSKTMLAAILVLGLMACSTVAAREPGRVAEDELPGDRAVNRTLVPGTLIVATIEDARPWRRYALGGTLTATVSADVQNARRWVVIPAESPVGLRIAQWGPAATRSQAGARITLEVRSVTVRGREYPVRATAELTGLAIHQPSGEVVVVAPGTRILFVLAEGFTAAHD